MALLQTVTEEATGEFDPIGTIVVLILIVLFAYAAYWAWVRADTRTGIKMWGYRGVAGITGGLAILFVISLLLNLAAAIGII